MRRRRYGRTRRRHRLGRIDLVNWAQPNYTTGPTLSAHIKPFVSGSHRTIGLDSTRLKKRKAGETQKKKKKEETLARRSTAAVEASGSPESQPLVLCGVAGWFTAGSLWPRRRRHPAGRRPATRRHPRSRSPTAMGRRRRSCPRRPPSTCPSPTCAASTSPSASSAATLRARGKNFFFCFGDL